MFIPPIIIAEDNFSVTSASELKLLGGCHDSLTTTGEHLDPGMTSAMHRSGKMALRYRKAEISCARRPGQKNTKQLDCNIAFYKLNSYLLLEFGIWLVA